MPTINFTPSFIKEMLREAEIMKYDNTVISKEKLSYYTKKEKREERREHHN
jgi:hypothetical protein